MTTMAADVTGGSSSRAQSSGVSGLLATMATVLAVRICILCIGLYSIHTAPPSIPDFNRAHPWMAWDAHAYFEIALNGYSPDRIGKPFMDFSTFYLIAYFPVVPLIGRAVSSVMPLDVAMVAFSNICSIIGFVFLYLWARRLAGERTAVICTLIVATFPGAVSFAAGMTEGPFFLMVALSLWLLQRDRFWWAALLVGIATATRPTGVAVAIIVPFYAWMRMLDRPLSERLGRFVLLGIISVSGLMAYEGFLWHRYDSPTIYFQGQRSWRTRDQQRVQRDASSGIARYSGAFFRDRLTRPQSWNYGIALLILILITVGFVKPMGIPRLLFLIPLIILLLTCLPDHGMRISSLPRYESGAAPLFLLPAIWLSTSRRTPWLASLLILMFAVQAYYAFLFPREIWVG